MLRTNHKLKQSKELRQSSHSLSPFQKKFYINSNLRIKIILIPLLILFLFLPSLLPSFNNLLLSTILLSVPTNKTCSIILNMVIGVGKWCIIFLYLSSTMEVSWAFYISKIHKVLALPHFMVHCGQPLKGKFLAVNSLTKYQLQRLVHDPLYPFYVTPETDSLMLLSAKVGGKYPATSNPLRGPTLNEISLFVLDADT